MTEPNFSKYFESKYTSESDRRRYAENSLIIDAAIALSKALDASKIQQKDLAGRLGKSEGYISQVLGGGCNLTLRTLADFAFSMDRMVEIALTPLDASSVVFTTTSRASWKLDVEESPKVEAADTQYALAA